MFHTESLHCFLVSEWEQESSKERRGQTINVWVNAGIASAALFNGGSIKSNADRENVVHAVYEAQVAIPVT